MRLLSYGLLRKFPAGNNQISSSHFRARLPSKSTRTVVFFLKTSENLRECFLCSCNAYGEKNFTLHMDYRSICRAAQWLSPSTRTPLSWRLAMGLYHVLFSQIDKWHFCLTYSQEIPMMMTMTFCSQLYLTS